MLAEGKNAEGLTYLGMLRQHEAFTPFHESRIQDVLEQYEIAPDVAEAGMAKGSALDFEAELEKIREDLAQSGGA